MTIATLLLPLLLGAAAVPAAEPAPVDAAVEKLFAPYSREPSPQAAWDFPVYSAETAALIAHWQRVRPSDEVDELSDGDWLCQCQDWDHTKFQAVQGKPRAIREGLVEVLVSIDVGWNARRTARLRLAWEGGAWRLDDIFYRQGMARGLKQALRDTIRADEALRADGAK